MRAGQANPKIRAMYAGLTGEDGRFNGTVRVALVDVLELPLRTKKPTVWAVWNDLFHAGVESGYIAAVWQVMAQTPQHTYIALTKRPARMKREVGDLARAFGVLPNVVLGVTVENAENLPRLLDLLATPAECHMASCEPLLGPVDLRPWLLDPEWFAILRESGVVPLPRLGWVVAGGESGLGARPVNPRWVLDLRDQCVAAGVPFMWKGWGEYVPADAFGDCASAEASLAIPHAPVLHWHDEYRDEWVASARVGRRNSGRLLGGLTWDGFPQIGG